MEFEKFEAAVIESVEQLPFNFKRILEEEGIEILARETVPRKVRETFPRAIVFGIFVGVSRKNKSSFMMQTEPTRIEIYQESFEKVYGHQLTDFFREKISQTVIHEIAHYFGFNEEEISERGY